MHDYIEVFKSALVAVGFPPRLLDEHLNKVNGMRKVILLIALLAAVQKPAPRSYTWGELPKGRDGSCPFGCDG